MNSFKRNTLFAAAGNFSTTAALAFILFGVVRLSDPQTVGQFSYALAICAPVFLLAGLRLRDVSLSESDDNYSLSTFVLVSFMSNLLGMVALLPIGFLLELDRITFLTAILIGFWKFGTSLGDIVYGYHQRQTNMPVIAKLQIAHCVCISIVFIAVLFFTRNILIAVGMLALANFAVLLLYDIRTIDFAGVISDLRSDFGGHFKRATTMLGATWPIGLAGAVFALNMLVPRKMLASFFTLEEVGVFSVLAFTARLGTPVMRALGQAASRQLSDSIQNRDSGKILQLLKKVISTTLGIGLIMVVAGGLLGPEVLRLVFGDKYQVESLSVVCIMVFATLVYVSTFLTYTLIIAGQYLMQLVIWSITVLTCLIACYFLVPNFGIQGACLGVMISSVVLVTGTGSGNFFIVRKLKISD